MLNDVADDVADKKYSCPKRRRASPLCVTQGTTREIFLAAEAFTIDYSTKAVLGSTKDGLDRSPKRQSKRKIWLHLVISMNPSRDIVPRTDELRTERYQSLTFHPNYQILRSTSCAI